MNRIRLKDKEFKLFIPECEILDAVRRMAVCIEEDMKGRNPLFVGILNGAFMFVSELMSSLNASHELVFARYSSYRGTSSTGRIVEVMPIDAEVVGRPVILLEDVIDTGYTVQYVMAQLLERGATEVKFATLLFKPQSQRCNIIPNYVGLEIPNDFVIGHGMDYDGLGRGYRDIYVLAEEEEL